MKTLWNSISNIGIYEYAIIKINARKDTNYCIISIKDNGIGIEKKYLDSIFNTFTRLHANSQYEGSGLGLANCKKIMYIHQGKIEIEIGSGTEMFLYFKAIDANGQ